ncbi:hypothetical protein [Robinsoniella sp. KNHs210]|uniref:hypothetical protein n=1 Tax=Robinsoniella sp. KNHs210 TaxID=1469950 RepID=UPI000481E469|nr:hypothetical protein [Robinsoniella sp. KNHs210]
MMKKRLVAFGLAGVMLMGMSMNVFAADGDVSNVNGATEDIGKRLDVSYTVPVSYTVTIPSTLTIDTGTDIADGTLSFVPKVLILDQGGTVNIKSDKISLPLTLTQEDGSPAYDVTLKGEDDGVLDVSDPIVTFENGTTDTKTIKVKGNSKPTVAGTYKGTLNFTISYKNK